MKKKAAVIRSIFEYYLSGASLGKVVVLFVKGILSPTGNFTWTRAAVDKFLANKKYLLSDTAKIMMAVAPQQLPDCIFFVNTRHCRQNLCLTIVMRRFCFFLLELH